MATVRELIRELMILERTHGSETEVLVDTGSEIEPYDVMDLHYDEQEQAIVI